MKKVLSVLLISNILISAAQNKSNFGCEDLEFNTRELQSFAYNERCKTESYPFLTKDGQHLYFTNNQGRDWIFYSTLDTNSSIWSVPVPIRIDNFDASILSSYYDESASVLYFTTGAMTVQTYKAVSVDGSRTHFTNPQRLSFSMVTGGEADMHHRPFSCLSFSQAGETMYAFISVSSTERSMAYFKKTGDDSYMFMGYLSNSPGEMGIVSEDGLEYYYSNNTEKNVLFLRKRESTSIPFATETYVYKTFESGLDIGQFRFSHDMKTIVLVLSQSEWNKNDIFFLNGFEPGELKPAAVISKESNYVSESEPILPGGSAYPAGLRPVSDNSTVKTQKTEVIGKTGKEVALLEIGLPFPNPARDYFYIYFNVNAEFDEHKPPVLVLTDNTGKVVYTQKLETTSGEVKVLPDRPASGVYYVRIDCNGLSSPAVRLTINQ